MQKEQNKQKEPFDMPMMLLKLAMTLTAFLLLLSATGCAHGGNVTDGCLGWQPIYVSRDDDLTDETARQILAHNEVGEQRCGW